MGLSFLRRWWPLAAVAALLAVAALAAANSSLQFARVDGPAPEPTWQFEEIPPATEVPTDGAGPRVEIPDWLAIVALALCTLVAATAIGIGCWMLLRDALRRGLGRMPGLRRSRTGLRVGTTEEEVVAALDAGLADLSDTDADPRRAVIACWVRLEQAAAAAGVARQVGDTPTDLVTRLLSAGRPVSADVLAAFADVYRAARYATHTVDERMRAQALGALRRLRAELIAPAAAAAAVGPGAAVAPGTADGPGAADAQGSEGVEPGAVGVGPGAAGVGPGAAGVGPGAGAGEGIR